MVCLEFLLLETCFGFTGKPWFYFDFYMNSISYSPCFGNSKRIIDAFFVHVIIN